ncbi:MAG TPA: hypothetical protein VHA30_04700, partial [Patescibacteria group bacterium]|nr:hypothetical protein [Patescibacteria group bacterium]
MRAYPEAFLSVYRDHPFTMEGLHNNFPAFVRFLNNQAAGKNLPPGYVPNTNYWLTDGKTYLGSLSFRHRLNHLLKRNASGHIGYEIAAPHRRRGYG